MRKRLISLIVALCLILSMLPTSVFAADEIDSGTCGENLTWSIDVEGTLTIFGSGPMLNYASAHDSPWYDQKEIIKKIVFGHGVTTISSYAFQGYERLSELIIPNSVTSIGEKAFNECNLLDIYFSGSTEEWLLFDDLFFNVPRIHHACTDAEQHWRTANVSATCSDPGYYYEVCTCGYERNIVQTESALGHNLSSWVVNIEPTCNKYGQKTRSCLRDGCSYTEILSIKPLEHTYENDVCTTCQFPRGLQFDIIDDNAARIIGYTGAASHLVIPADLLGYPVTRIHRAFTECNSLITVTLPESIVDIGEHAFASCSNLEKVTIPDSVTNIGLGTFYQCSSLNEITLHNGISVIGDNAFEGCTNLTYITFPDSLSEIGNNAFENCTSLTDIVIGDNVTQLRSAAFYNCSSLTSVRIGSGITDMKSSIFCGCTNLMSVSIENGVTNIGILAFSDCASLAEVFIPNSVSRIDTGAFQRCTNLKSIVFSDGLTYIGERAFWKCVSLFDIILPEGVTIIDDDAFADCTQLKSIVLPESVTEIGLCAFSNCTNLTDIFYRGTEEQRGKISYTLSSFGDGVSPEWHFDVTDVIYNGQAALYCSSCGGYFALDGHKLGEEHVHEYISVITLPSCTEGGYTSYSCSCGDSYIDNEVPATGHTEVIDAAVQPTCTGSGLTEGSHCSVCGEVLVKQDVITALGHTEVVDPAVTPTCTESGLTEGKHCSVCESVLVERKMVEATGHAFDEGVVTKEPTENETGIRTYTCASCGGTKEEEIPTLDHEHVHKGVVTDPTCTEEGYTTFTCSCGDSYIDNKVPALGHTEVIDAAVAATCTETGLTEGKHCSVCNEILVKQEVITAKGHLYEDGFCEVCGTEDPNYIEPTEPSVPDETEPTAPSEPEQTEPSEPEETDPTVPSEPEESEPTMPSEPDETEPTEPEEPTEPADHTHFYSEWTIAKDPTSTEEGLEERSCSCGDTEYRTIAKLSNPFSDVKESDYFFEPVLWAAHRGVTSGMSATSFGPNNSCTRAQVVTFLWRAASKPEPSSGNNPFRDVKESDYFYKAVLWAVEKGITAGTSSNTFSPSSPCTRGQVVTFLYRSAGTPALTSSRNPFSDVKSTDYYYDAVLWAVEEGITAGISATRFGPGNTCTRGQVVTFLYRAFAK